MSTIWEEIRYKVLRSGNKLNLLIGINVAIFLIINLIGVGEWLFTHGKSISATLFDYLAVTAYLPKLATRFWTPFTYMFMHDGIFHILFNMLWLFWIGQILQEYLGDKKLLTVYILGGLGGALIFIAGYNIFPAFKASGEIIIPTVGASASVMAVIVATATLLPDYTISMMFFGAVKLKWLAIVYILFDLLSIVGPNAGGELAHLGGALVGYIYIKQLRGNNNWGTSIGSMLKPKSHLKISINNNFKTKAPKPREEEIDRILDKISQSGYESLNKQEKEVLFRASNDDKS